jgi:hypothetical protein
MKDAATTAAIFKDLDMFTWVERRVWVPRTFTRSGVRHHGRWRIGARGVREDWKGDGGFVEPSSTIL